MKKLFLGVMLILGIGTTQVNAQVISGGVKGDIGFSGLSKKGAKNTLGVGASVGGFAKIEFTENFAIQPELLFQLKNSKSKLKSTNIKSNYQYFGLQLPVYALGQFDLGNGKFYGGVGPYIGFGLDAKEKTQGIKRSVYKNKTMRRFDFGAGALVGYEFRNKMQVNAGYKMGFVDLNKVKGGPKRRNHEFSVGVGYRF